MKMPKQLFNKFSDLPALEAEKSRVLNIFGQIKTGIIDLNNLGFKLNTAKSVSEANAAAKELQALQQRMLDMQRKMDDAVLKSQTLQAKADEARARADRQQLQLSEQKAKAIEREQQAQDKLNKTKMQEPEVVPGHTSTDTYDYNWRNTGDGQVPEGFTNQRAQLKKEPVINKQDIDNVVKYKDELEQLTGTLRQNTQLHAQLKTDLGGVQTAIKGLENNTTDAQKSTTAYKSKIDGLRQDEAALKQELKEVSQTMRLQTIEQNNGANSLKALQARLELSKNAYDKMSAAERATPLGQRLLTDIQRLSPQVSALEQQTGRFQRNVGNYTSGLTNFFSKAFGGLRQLAYLIPGLGMQGIIMVVVTGLVAIISKLNIFDSTAKKIQKGIKAATDEANESIGQQVGKVQALYKASQDLALSTEQRRRASAELVKINKDNNKLTGDHTQLLTDQNGVLKENDKAINQLSESLIKQAKTKAFLNEIEKAQTALIKAQNLELQDATNTFENVINGSINAVKTIASNPLKIFDIPGLVKAQQRGIFFGAKDAKQEGIDKAQKYLDGIQAELIAGIKSGKLSFAGVFGTDADGSKAAEDMRKAAQELFKYQMQQKIAEQQALAALAINTKAQTDARKKQYELERELINGNANFELAKAKQTADEKQLIRLKAESDLTDIETKRDADITSIRLTNFNKVYAEAERMNKEYTEQQIADAEKAKQKQIDSLSNNLNFSTNKTDIDAQKKIDAELKLYQQGKINKEQYELRKNKIEADAQRDSLQATLIYYSQLMAISSLSTADQKSAAKEFFDLLKKLRAQDVKDAEDAEAKKLAFQQSRKDAYKELAQEGVNTISALLNAGVDRQKNQIQEQLDNIDKVRAAEIDRVNASTEAEEKKAARIALIDAKAQSDREALERRQRELDQKKAMYDREVKAFEIITSGIQAVAELTFKALANPAYATLIPIAITTRAAQLVALLATPLPKYYTGVESSPETYAHTAERGRELAIERDGNVKLFNHPAIRYIKAGTRIFNNEATESILSAAEKDRAALMQAYGNNTNTTIVRSEDERILEQLKLLNKRSSITIVNKTPIETTAWYNKQMKH